MEKENQKSLKDEIVDNQRASECELLGSSKTSDSPECASPRDTVSDSRKEYFCGIGESLRPKWLQVRTS